MRFFFYGTLLDRDVAALVLGRRLPPIAFCPAILPGHVRRRAKGVTYPVLSRDPRSEVSGVVVGGLSKRDVARLSAYEGPRYRVAYLKARIAGALTRVAVFEPIDGGFEMISGPPGIWRPGSSATNAPSWRASSQDSARTRRIPGSNLQRGTIDPALLEALAAVDCLVL
jgi:hypothetical protein